MDLLLLVSLLFIAGLLLQRFFIWRKLPPGPVGWPVVGHLFSVTRPLHRHFAALAKKYATPILYVDMGSRPTVVISTPELAREVFREHDIQFASRPSYSTPFKYMSHNYNDLVFAPYGGRWRYLRRICNIELFTSGIRTAELHAFAEDIAKQEGEVNLTLKFQELLTNLMSSVLFGKKFYNTDAPSMEEARAYRATWGMLAQESGKLYLGDYIPALRWIDRLKGRDHRMRTTVMPALHALLNSAVEERREEQRHRQGDSPPTRATPQPPMQREIEDQLNTCVVFAITNGGKASIQMSESLHSRGHTIIDPQTGIKQRMFAGAIRRDCIKFSAPDINTAIGFAGQPQSFDPILTQFLQAFQGLPVEQRIMSELLSILRRLALAQKVLLADSYRAEFLISALGDLRDESSHKLFKVTTSGDIVAAIGNVQAIGCGDQTCLQSITNQGGLQGDQVRDALIMASGVLAAVRASDFCGGDILSYWAPMTKEERSTFYTHYKQLPDSELLPVVKRVEPAHF